MISSRKNKKLLDAALKVNFPFNQMCSYYDLTKEQLKFVKTACKARICAGDTFILHIDNLDVFEHVAKRKKLI